MSIAVRVPPTCARSSTLSTAENWPRKRPVACTVRCSGRLTVTCGGGGGGGGRVFGGQPGALAAPRRPVPPRRRRGRGRATVSGGGRAVRLPPATRVRSATSWSVREMLSMS